MSLNADSPAENGRSDCSHSRGAKVGTPVVEAPPAVPRSPAPPLRKDHPRPSSTAVPKAAPAPTEHSRRQSRHLTAITTADPAAETAAPPTIKPQIQYKDGTYFGLGQLPPRRYPGIRCDPGWTDCFDGNRPMPDALFHVPGSSICRGQVVSRQSANVDYRVGRHREQRRILRCGRRRRCPKPVSDDVYLRTVALMGTVVTIQVVGHGADPTTDNPSRGSSRARV